MAANNGPPGGGHGSAASPGQTRGAGSSKRNGKREHRNARDDGEQGHGDCWKWAGRFIAAYTRADAVIDSAELAVGAVMCLFMRANDPGRPVYPSAETLAQRTGFSVRAVKDAQARLREKGWATSVGGEKGGAGITRRHVMHMQSNRAPDARINDQNHAADARFDSENRAATTEEPCSNDPKTVHHVHTNKGFNKGLNKGTSFAADQIAFDPTADGSAFGGWTGIQHNDIANWQAAFPACAVQTELAGMAEWVKANPRNRKRQWRRFIVNWLMRSQDRAPRVQHPSLPGGSKKVAL